MRIEKLEPSAHKQGRWLVWFEDGSLLRVGEGDVVSLGLYQGLELTQEQAGRLADAAEQSRVDARAVELAARRPMSRRELVDKLSAPPRPRRRSGQNREEPGRADPEELERQRAVQRERAERAADRLEALGLLNDGAYADSLVRHYSAKGYGPRKIRDELYRRGVPREYWEDALKQCEDSGGDEADGGSALNSLLERKLRGQALTRESLKRASDYLARRGFGWEEIAQAIERFRRQREAEEEEQINGGT